LLQVGESSGRLADMARRAGDLAAQEAERALKTLVTLVEPALIVAFGDWWRSSPRRSSKLCIPSDHENRLRGAWCVVHSERVHAPRGDCGDGHTRADHGDERSSIRRPPRTPRVQPGR